MTYDAGDPEDVQKAKTKADKARQDQLADMKALLSRTDARAFLWRLLERCRLYSVSFDGTDRTFFNEGERSIGLWTFQEIMAADPDAYALMIKEAKETENG